MPKPRASVGVALIARNAAKTLPDCLNSLRPYVSQIVVCVDETTTDKTEKVARKHGVEVYPVQVSDWHECPQHGRVLAQNFAKARQESFSHLRRDLDFWLWIDADDVLVGGEKLPAILAATPPECVGLWLPYDYNAVTEHGVSQVNTVFHRERLLRTHLGGQPVQWTWQNRVHETVAPNVPARWIKTEEVRVVHQEGQHRSENSAPRNLLLLEIEYEEDPGNTRTIFYLGNQYFAMGEWLKAAYWYEKTNEVSKNDYELWQANIYACKAYQRLGDPNNALKAAMAALEVRPEHPEPYFSMAEVYTMTGEWEKVEHWTHLGRKMKPVPFYVFSNPLDFKYHQHLPLADALYHQGRLTEARHELESAHRVFPADGVKERIDHLATLENNANRASAFVEMATGLDDAGIIGLWRTLNLPPEVKQFGRCRDVYVPAVLRGRTGTQPRIVFWCGRALEPWAPPVLDSSGIGGSETAVVHIAKRFAQEGWQVDVYNGAERWEGVYDGVGYFDPERYVASDAADVFVSWRSPASVSLAPDGASRLLWCHDLNYGPLPPDALAGFDRVLGVSRWHADMLGRYYDITNSSALSFVPNGIDLSRFSEHVSKVPHRCVYASSPDRGLQRLLHLWPKIIGDEPAAELHVAYGWENIDKMIGQGRTDLADFKAEIMGQIEKTRGVVWRGRMGQQELAKLYSESMVWLYPTSFLEVSCISAMEAMAGGCVPVCSSVGALGETVGDGGYPIPGSPYSRAWHDVFTQVARATLFELNTWKVKELAGREHVKALTWDAAYKEHWRPMVEGMLGGEQKPAGICPYPARGGAGINIIFDARVLRFYPVGKPGFHGGTELYLKKLAHGLALNGHTVHVVTPDLDTMEQRGPTEFWWPPTSFPTAADAVVLMHNLQGIEIYRADFLILASNGVDPYCGPNHEWASIVDAFPVFSEKHAELLCQIRPTVERAKCHVTGLGVDLDKYRYGEVPKIPYRLLYANDPARGLLSLLNIFDIVRKDVPEASLHITYDFYRQFEEHRWEANALAEQMWECKRRVETTPNVVNVGQLAEFDLTLEQEVAQVHCMPSDPPNIGSQIHGITQMECAAAGCALVLSDIEAFPEVFGDGAEILPVPGKFLPAAERRCDAQDWADVVVELMKDEAKWHEASRKARSLAEKHTWADVVKNFDAMLVKLAGVPA